MGLTGVLDGLESPADGSVSPAAVVLGRLVAGSSKSDVKVEAKMSVVVAAFLFPAGVRTREDFSRRTERFSMTQRLTRVLLRLLAACLHALNLLVRARIITF
jgi:hypothetical protein